MCVREVLLYLWFNQSELMAPFVVLKLWMVQALFLSL